MTRWWGDGDQVVCSQARLGGWSICWGSCRGTVFEVAIGAPGGDRCCESAECKGTCDEDGLLETHVVGRLIGGVYRYIVVKSMFFDDVDVYIMSGV